DCQYYRRRGSLRRDHRPRIDVSRRRVDSLRSPSQNDNVRARRLHDERVHLEGREYELIARPTTTTTTAPIRLCQRKAIGVVNATVRTTTMPATSPQNAPVPVARFVRIARMNTPRIEP